MWLGIVLLFQPHPSPHPSNHPAFSAFLKHGIHFYTATIFVCDVTVASNALPLLCVCVCVCVSCLICSKGINSNVILYLKPFLTNFGQAGANCFPLVSTALSLHHLFHFVWHYNYFSLSVTSLILSFIHSLVNKPLLSICYDCMYYARCWGYNVGKNRQVSYREESIPRTSLVVQWFRTCLPMQGTRVRSLVGELRSHTLRGN